MVNDNKKNRDVIGDVARKIKNKTLNKVKNTAITKVASVLFAVLLKILPLVLITSLLATAFEWLIEIFEGEDTPEIIYSSLLGDMSETKDLSNLIELKGDSDNGYYWEFKDETDSKIDEAINKMGKAEYTAASINKELLKKMIKAELITQYPNLGGKVDEGADQFQGAIKIRRITPNKAYGEIKNTSSGEVTKQNITYSADTVEQVVEGDRIHTIGIMASHSKDSPGATSPNPESNEEQLKEEELTVKVAKYIEQAIGVYANIKIVQIGSTEEDSNVSDEIRLQKAREANIEALIGIAFNSSGDGTKYDDKNGVSITYNPDGGTEDTKRLGEILKKSVSTSMDLNIADFDKQDTSNTLGTKEDSFISLTVNGGYLTSKKDYAIISQDYGLQLYAKGVIAGILEYYGIENKGYGTMIDGTSSTSSTIESKITDLKYVPLEQFENDLNDAPGQALREFSLDENYKLITATWNYANNTITVTKNGTVLDYKSIMSKYTMPMEYALAWYIDTQNADFVSNLVQLALDSEFIIMLEDNVKTTRVITTTEQSSQTNQQDTSGNYSINVESVELHQTNKETTITERVSTQIELIYADTWFVKFNNKLLLEPTAKNNQNANGTVTQNDSSSISDNTEVEEWEEKETVPITHLDEN